MRLGQDKQHHAATAVRRAGHLAWWLAGVLGCSAALAQVRYEPLRSFGTDDKTGSHPPGGAILAVDGLLYGLTTRGGSNNLGTVYVLTPDGSGYRALKQFQGSDGATPAGQLLDGGDGSLYGITGLGGDSTNGVIFRLDRAGGNFVMLHSLAADRSEGALPLGGLTALPGVALAGVASLGGAHGGGTLFRLSRDGEDFEVLHHFGASTNDGKTPKSRLLLASDGFLYGTTEAGGAANAGTIFRVSPDGSGYEVLLEFQPATQGKGPDFGFVEGLDGRLYGVTAAGGADNLGTVYRFRPADKTLEVLRHFRLGERGQGYRPSALIFNPAKSLLWGTTLSGGTNEAGVFFQIKPDGSDYQVLAHLGGAGSGRFAYGELALTPDGRVVSATLSGGPEQGGTLMAWNTASGQLQVLHTFLPGGLDARTPSADLIEGRDGFLYGTASQGGNHGRGTVFRLQKDLTGYQILHHFGETAQDGEAPVAPLCQDANGTLYGTTAYRAGGAAGGTIFKLQPDGSGYQVLKRFTSRATEGALLVSGLTLTSDGWLLGLAVEGGANNGGTCFRLRPDGSEFSVLHAFGQDDDGAAPADGLTPCEDGFLYGVLNSKGAFDGGVIFRIQPNGQGYQVLRNFGQTATDGKLPVGGLLCRSDGYLYGTCAAGGASGQGTIFRVRRDSSDYTTLHHFSTNSVGVQPRSRLAEWRDGRLYGTTASDVLSGLGTVFAINPDGSNYALVVRFRDLTLDGYRPWAGLLAASDGGLYGTVSQGGIGNSGRLYRLSHDAWVRFTSIRAESSAQARLQGEGVAGANYRIERSNAVGPTAAWTEAAQVRSDAAGRWEWVAPIEPGVPGAFYRASRQP
jgi:uncharacterized repeat protein (TIGR03803 family)